MWQGPGNFSPVMPPHAFPQYPPSVPLFPDNSKGHQIPMLSDKSSSEEMPYQQPPLQPIPPGPQSTLPQTGGIDWSIISSCSPEQLAETNDIETLSAIIQSFIHSKFTQTEAQLMPNPLTAKFFRILQIAVTYLLDCQRELKENLDESEKSELMLKAKVKNLSASLQRAKDECKKSERIKETTEKCVVCGRRFKNVNYLDGHVQRRHGALMPAWRSLRTGQLQGMNDFVDQIENLRQEVAKANHKLEKREQEEMQKAPVTHIVSHSDQQIRLLKELIDKQDEMMKQAKENEEKQLSFRKEMRNQLDDAVFALQDAQKQLDVQTTRISQMPLIPQPAKPSEPVKEDELGSSLTEQLMKPALDKQKVAFNLDKLLNEIPESPFKPEAKKPSIIDKYENEAKTRIDDESKNDDNKSNTDKSDVVNDANKSESKSENKEEPKNDREKQHQKVLDKLSKEEETSEDEKVKKEKVKKTMTERERIEELLRRGKYLINHTIDPNEETNRDASLTQLTESTLHQFDTKLAELKKSRPYAAISVPFVAKKMDEGTKEYKTMYNKLNAFVGSEVPAISDEFKKNLFKDRKTQFPLLPPIKKLTQKQLLEQRQRKSTQKIEKQQGVPKIPEEFIAEASKKIPYKQRIYRNRPRLLPGDSDVEIVDKFSSEYQSDASVGFIEDPTYYKRYGANIIIDEDKPVKKTNDKDFEEIHLSSASSSSSVIQPLKNDEDETKVFNLSEFTDSSDNENTRKQENIKKTKSDSTKKNKKNDKSNENIKIFNLTDSDDSDDDRMKKKKKAESGKNSAKNKNDAADQFVFEEEEEDDDNSTQEIKLNNLNKTKTLRFNTVGSGDFDVTKKQSSNGGSASDAIFNLMSDFSSGDDISDDENNNGKNKNKNKK